ncbi:hypothetical protein I5I71_22525, partial [Pseudomonas aeruginosa]|nr:hypothetical protein [Pseudomonas aeruginosa]
FFMRVAMGLAIEEKDREARAIEFYNLLSSFDYMSCPPPPVNARPPRAPGGPPLRPSGAAPRAPHHPPGGGLPGGRPRRLRSTKQATVPGKRAPVPQSPLRIFCALQRLFQGLLQRSDRMAHGMAMAELEVVQQVRR